LELRRHSGVRSHSSYESSRHFDSRPPSCGKLVGCSRLHATHYANTRITTDRGICEVFGFESNWCSEKRSRNTEIAKMLGVSRQTVSDWFAGLTVWPRVTSLGMQRLIAQTEPCFASDAIDRPHFFSASDGVESNAFLFSGVYRRVVVMSLARWPSCRRQF
jgi:Helix-turn-helix